MTSFSELGSLWTGPLSDPHRYRVDLHPDGLRAVGNGGEGLVYRASTVSEGRSVDVALKMLTTLTPDDYPRLAERAAALGNVIHPNVMRHLEVFIGCPLVAEDRTPEDEFELVYSAAAWVPGSPLEEGTSEAGPGVGLQWVGQIAEATDYLHRFRGPGAPDGFVHRDIKPSNVRVTPDSRAVLIDFGVARPHSTGDLTEGVGTYLWRAPEIVGGPGTPGKASDVWGVGALAFWAIVGEPPRLEGAELAAAKMREAAGGWDFRDPAALAAHVAALLETHPDRRPTDLAAWSRELRAITSGHRRRRSSWHASARVAGLAALGAAVVVGGLVVGSSVAHMGQGTARSIATLPQHGVSLSRGGSGTTPTTSPVSTSKLNTLPTTTGSTKTSNTTSTAAGGSSSGGGGTQLPLASSGTTAPQPVHPVTVTPATSPPATSPTGPSATSPPTSPTSQPITPASTWSETPGGGVHTWTNYANAGGNPGAMIPAYMAVQIQCRVQGFRVADGNTWWYQIESSPWNDTFYGSSDAFYNNGATSGSLIGTPFVDTAVPVC